MNEPLSYPELIAIQALMQLMLQAALAEDWTELARIDKQRKALLEKDSIITNEVKSTSFTRDDAYISIVDAVRKLDQEIIATVMQARDGLAVENKVLRDQVNAKAIYQQASVMTSNSHR